MSRFTGPAYPALGELQTSAPSLARPRIYADYISRPFFRWVKFSAPANGALADSLWPISVVGAIGGVRRTRGAGAGDIVRYSGRVVTIFFVGQWAIRRYLVGGYGGRNAWPLNLGPDPLTGSARQYVR